MKLAEKLEKLTEGRSRAELSRQAGLPANAISDYINKGYWPRLDTAAALARVLSVDLGWLADNAQDWPPATATSLPLASFSDDELMHEVASRHRRALLALLESLRAANGIDWEKAAADLERIKPGDPPSDLARQAFSSLVAVELRLARAMQDFDLYFYSVTHHSTLPGKEHSLSELERLESGHAYGEFADNPAVPRFAELAKLLPDFQSFSQKPALEKYKTTAREFNTLLSPPRQGRK